MKMLKVPMIFVDESSAKILLTTLSRPKSAIEISKDSGIPVAEVFFRLRVMEKTKLIERIVYRFDLKGHEVPVFQSKLDHPYVYVDKGRLKTRFQLVRCDRTNFFTPTEALI